MPASLTIDTRQFSRALLEYKEATQKDEPEILNRAAKNIAYRAAQNTPKASAARIRSQLMADPNLRYALTSLQLRKRGMGILKKPDFQKAVQTFVARRAASAGFIRSGWANAIVQLGGSFRGKQIAKGKGWAKKATLNRLIAEIVNTVLGADKVGREALQAAVDFVSADMISYAEQKMAQRARQFSAI